MSERAQGLITRLTLTDFRNYAALRLEVAAEFVLLTGPNGAGKTNLIEAISLLGPGRGLRGAEYGEMVRHGARRFAVAALAEDTPLGTEWSLDGGPRRLVLGGKPARSASALTEALRLLWVTPAMDGLFTGPPSERRRFLDRLVQSLVPTHADALADFEKAMRERNRLLGEARADPAWLSALEAAMAEAGAAIAAQRVALLEALSREIARAPREGVFPWAEIGVSGGLETALERMPAVQAEDEYRMLLADSRADDRAAGRCLSGPHRSDLTVMHGPKAMAARLCSTGEQKALLTGIALAQAAAVARALGRPPVLLLDEIAAHFDRDRRQGLYRALGALGAQCWMTGTERQLFGDLPAGTEHFSVAGATVTRTR